MAKNTPAPAEVPTEDEFAFTLVAPTEFAGPARKVKPPQPTTIKLAAVVVANHEAGQPTVIDTSALDDKFVAALQRDLRRHAVALFGDGVRPFVRVGTANGKPALQVRLAARRARRESPVE